MLAVSIEQWQLYLHNQSRSQFMADSNKYRVTTISETGERKVMRLTEVELQKLRSKRLQKIRKEDSDLTQK